MSQSQKLLEKFALVSDQVDTRELGVILREAEKVLARSSQGALVEFGCYAGTTSMFLRRLLDGASGTHEFHVYDSFAGLPEKTSRDQSAAGDQFVAGELAASKKHFVSNFKKAGLALPVIHKGWFSEVRPEAVPDEIIFAFLDGDYYESIRDSLRCIENRLSLSTVIVVDDYANEALPGAAQAVDDWHHMHPEFSLRVEASLAILTRIAH